jgi:6-phosphogluconolactonase
MKNTRRAFAFLLIAVAPLVLFFAANSSSGKSSEKEYLAFVGTYTAKTDSKGIYSFRFDSESGRISSLGLAAPAADPSWLTISGNGKNLYSVNELSTFEGASSGAITSYALDPKTGKLTSLNQVASGGADPCFMSLDKTGKYLLVANYTGGSVAAFPIEGGGRLGAPSAKVQHQGSGPKKEQASAHAHYITTSADNRFAFAADLGMDEVMIYRFDAAHGTLTPNQTPFMKLDAGSGPRHLAFSRSEKFGYVLSELKSTVTVLAYDSKSGAFSTIQTLSTLPKDFAGENSTAEIVVHPSGKFVYASNRGHDSIAVFTIAEAKGTLTPSGIFPTQGKTPRNFALDPSGKFLLAENEESNNIVVFQIDGVSGALKAVGQPVQVPAPVDIVFVDAK